VRKDRFEWSGVFKVIKKTPKEKKKNNA